MSVAAQDGQGNGDGDAPADADSDGVGYVSYDESASDTEVPAANHRDENDPLGQAPMNVALLPSRGKYDQRAAKRAPMQPAKSHHQASRRLRNLLPKILKTTKSKRLRSQQRAKCGSVSVSSTSTGTHLRNGACMEGFSGG